MQSSPHYEPYKIDPNPDEQILSGEKRAEESDLFCLKANDVVEMREKLENDPVSQFTLTLNLDQGKNLKPPIKMPVINLHEWTPVKTASLLVWVSKNHSQQKYQIFDSLDGMKFNDQVRAAFQRAKSKENERVRDLRMAREKEKLQH